MSFGLCGGTMYVDRKLWRGLNRMLRHQRHLCCMRKRVVRRGKTMVYLKDPWGILKASDES